MGGRLGKLSWVVTSSGEDGKPLQRERELQIEGTTSTEVLQMQTARNFHLGAQNRYDVEWKLIKPASCFLYNTQTYVFLEPLEFFFNLTGGWINFIEPPTQGKQLLLMVSNILQFCFIFIKAKCNQIRKLQIFINFTCIEVYI